MGVTNPGSTAMVPSWGDFAPKGVLASYQIKIQHTQLNVNNNFLIEVCPKHRMDILTLKIIRHLPEIQTEPGSCILSGNPIPSRYVAMSGGPWSVPARGHHCGSSRQISATEQDSPQQSYLAPNVTSDNTEQP